MSPVLSSLMTGSFVDKDCALFKHVLNSMRDGSLHLPDDFPHLRQLQAEAVYYQLTALTEALHKEALRQM